MISVVFILMELVKLGMFCGIPCLIFDAIFDQELIDLRFEHEGNIDEIFAKLVQKTGRAFRLEGSQLVKIGPELL